MPPRIGRSPLRRPQPVDDLPASPPAHLLRDVDGAARRARDLHELDYELHFELDADRRVLVQLRELNGRVLRTIPPSEALELLSGRPLPDRTADTPTPPNRNVS